MFVGKNLIEGDVGGKEEVKISFPPWNGVGQFDTDGLNRLTFVRTVRAVGFVAGYVEDGAFDGDVGWVVGFGACGVRMSGLLM